MIEIKNENMCVGIALVGAELEYIKINGINILWQRSDLWSEQSPILFPNVGTLKDNIYEYNGNIYTSFVHGFVKSKKFTIKEQNETRVLLRLESNDDTKKIYPFEFVLEIEYEITDNSLVTRFKVTNNSISTMYFSLGIHPGFSYWGVKCLLGDFKLNIRKKLYDSVDFDLAYVKGEHKETLESISLPDFSKKLAVVRTLCYKNLKEVEFKGESHSINIENNMNYTAFWQKKPENNPEFLCVEGWCGFPDYINADKNIKNKKNLISLASGMDFNTCYIITYKKNNIS